MRRREFLTHSSAAALGLAALPACWSIAADAPKRKLLMFTRSAGFQHSVIFRKDPNELSHAERIFTELGKEHGFEVTATKDGTVFDSDLDQFDAFLFYTTGDLTSPKSADGAPPMSAEGKKRLLAAVAGGKGFLGSHCASDTFHTKGPARERQLEPDSYIAMLGGEFISHGAQQKSRMVNTAGGFPGLEKLGADFELEEEWYSLKNLAEDMHVILVQDTQGMQGDDYNRPVYPATWARNYDKGRVFYTSMGHREDVWTNPTFQQVLLAGVNWATGNTQFDPKSNFQQVTPGGQVMPSPKKKSDA